MVQFADQHGPLVFRFDPLVLGACFAFSSASKILLDSTRYAFCQLFMESLFHPLKPQELLCLHSCGDCPSCITSKLVLQASTP